MTPADLGKSTLREIPIADVDWSKGVFGSIQQSLRSAIGISVPGEMISLFMGNTSTIARISG